MQQTSTETKWEPTLAFEYLCEFAGRKIRAGRTIEETFEDLGQHCKHNLTNDQLVATLTMAYTRNEVFPAMALQGDWVTLLITNYSQDWKAEEFVQRLNLPSPYARFNPKSIQAMVLLFAAFQWMKKFPESGKRLKRRQRVTALIFIVIGVLLFAGSAAATVFLFTAGWIASLTIAGVIAGLAMVGKGFKEMFILDIKLRKYAP